MAIKVERGSVPLGGAAASMGVLPEEFNCRDVTVSYTDGSVGKACHVATNGQYFSMIELTKSAVPFDSIVFDEVSYKGIDGELKIFAIPPADPVPFKTGKSFTLGYVTKLNGKRWGFNFNYDPKTGRGQFVKDPGSPIVGVYFHLVNK